MQNTTKSNRISLAKKAVLGTAIGDAFGQSFFTKSEIVEVSIRNQKIPHSNWVFTDDTIMTIALFKSLERYQEINQEYVAKEFANNYQKEWNRGYGPSMHRRLKAIREGADWLQLSQSAFDGEGSIGNGGAMRVAVIGAYFYDSFDVLIKETIKSCKITHYNDEAIAGAIAVAVAAALSTRIGLGEEISSETYLHTIIKQVPQSSTLDKIKKIKEIPNNYHIETVKNILGDSLSMRTQDTVPFALWNVYHHLKNYESCLWQTVSGLGDRDTTCAIAGGISILSSEKHHIPQLWQQSVESWEESIFYKENNHDRETNQKNQ